MTQTYHISGMTCEGCVAKVKSKLLMHPDVRAAVVTLADHKAIVSMKSPLSVTVLQEAIGQESHYRISENDIIESNILTTGEKTSWLATYKPLLLIAAFIGGVSVATSGGDAGVGMNHFMAGFFLVFSFFKMLDLKGFASSYAMYDVLAIRVPVYGYVYPFIELALGMAYLIGFNPFFTNWATVLVMSFSSIGVILSVVNKQKIRCACLGAVFNLPMSTVTIIEDLLMVAMAAALLF